MKAPGPKPRGFLAFGCGDRIRTGVHGFAGRCLATRPRRSWFNRSDDQMICKNAKTPQRAARITITRSAIELIMVSPPQGSGRDRSSGPRHNSRHHR